MTDHSTRVLVSLCNFVSADKTSLLAIDLNDGRIDPVAGLRLGVGTTGICRYGRWILVAYQLKEGLLAVLDASTLAFVDEIELPGCSDPHSITPFDDGIAVVSTGSDEILHYQLHGRVFGKARRVFAYGDERADRHHLNGIAATADGLVWSGFGARDADRPPTDGLAWTAARSGFLQVFGQTKPLREKLIHPHTVRLFEGKTYFCESSIGSFRSLERTVAVLDGYTRGIDFIDSERAAVGTSVGRRKSRSTGRILNPLEDGIDTGTCAVHIVNIASQETERVYPVEPYAREIYDILAL